MNRYRYQMRSLLAKAAAALMIGTLLCCMGAAAVRHAWLWIVPLLGGIAGILFLAYYALELLSISDFMAKFDVVQPNFSDFPAKLSVTRQLKYVLTSQYEISVQRYKEEIAEKGALFSALQSQINPHFLYNTLECVRSEALCHQERGIAEMVETLGNFFRYSISRKGSYVTLEEELNNVRNYFKIQQYRFEDRFRLSVDTGSDDTWLSSYPVPKLILQPIVENAISHGLEGRPGAGRVLIRLERTEHSLVIHIYDDGVGMSEDRVQEINRMLRDCLQEQSASVDSEARHNGIALCNIRRQLQLLYGDNCGMFVKSTPQCGTEMELILPAHPSRRDVEDPHGT